MNGSGLAVRSLLLVGSEPVGGIYTTRRSPRLAERNACQHLLISNRSVKKEQRISGLFRILLDLNGWFCYITLDSARLSSVSQKTALESRCICGAAGATPTEVTKMGELTPWRVVTGPDNIEWFIVEMVRLVGDFGSTQTWAGPTLTRAFHCNNTDTQPVQPWSCCTKTLRKTMPGEWVSEWLTANASKLTSMPLSSWLYMCPLSDGNVCSHRAAPTETCGGETVPVIVNIYR